MRLQDRVDLRNPDKNRLTSLSHAAVGCNLEVFEWLLLDYGHDDHELSRDADNNTIFHLLASLPSPTTPSSSSRSLADQTTVVLRMTHLYHTLFPFLIDWSNSGGKTALHVAAQAGNFQFVQLLCDFGADVDLTDLQGNTPLHYASAWGHLETIRVLLERGCQFATRNFEGFTASDFSFSNTTMKALQDIARELFEERRTRRREERGGLMISNAGGRMRSGSASTANSGGSSSVGLGGAAGRDYDLQQKEQKLRNRERSISGSTGGDGKPPPPFRSPSLPHVQKQPPTPQLPTDAASIMIRRTNSAQAPGYEDDARWG
ncbi:hypothetical protein P7C73_g1771, partial [Tremellales sp. Uapishka_1]